MVHVRDLDSLDDADRRSEVERVPGIVRVDVHLERGRIADHEKRVADLLELALERLLSRVLALDHEHGAVAVLGELQVDRVEPERLGLDRRIRELLAGRAVDHAARDLDEPGPARVDDAGIAQDVEHLRRPRERVLTRRENGLEEVVGRDAAQLLPLALLRHLADDGQHRPLDGSLHRAVGRVARATERAAEQRRADALVRAEHLDEPAHDLREDDARVPAGAHERGARDVLRHGLAVGRARRIERFDDRPQRENEVRAGVAVGYRVDVQVVDAPAVRFEILERAAREMSDDVELHQCDRTPSMCTSSDAIGSPTMRSSSYWTRERTVSATSASFSPCSTTTRSSTTSPSAREIDVDALLDPPGNEPRESTAPGERDDAVALGRGGTDDLRDRVRRHGNAPALGRGDHEGLALHGSSLLPRESGARRPSGPCRP